MDFCPMGGFPYTIQPGDSLWLIAQKFHTDVQSIISLNSGTDLSVIYIGQEICVPIKSKAMDSGSMCTAELDLSNLLRLLWQQHVYWTRLFIISSVFNLPDVNFTTNRLLRNPSDFEAALKPLYGTAAAAKFTDLLKAHLTIAAELVVAAKAGNNAAAADAERRWYANADEIASFLSSINPYWPAQKWRRLLYDHLAMTKNEAVDFLERNYAGSISVFESIEKEVLEMADIMTSGIIKQFPNLITTQ